MLSQFLNASHDNRRHGLVSTVIDLFRGVLRLVHPEHPLRVILQSAMNVLSEADDDVVDAVLTRKLRSLKAQLTTCTDDIQRQKLERRIAAIAAALTE